MGSSRGDRSGAKGNGSRQGVVGANSNGSSFSAPKVDTAAAQPQDTRGRPLPPPRSGFRLRLSPLFLLLAFAISTAIAFCIGFLARLVLLTHLGLDPHSQGVVVSNNNNDAGSAALVAPLSFGATGGMSNKRLLSIGSSSDNSAGKKTSSSKQLPAPKVIEGKEVPFTTYASKTFQMEGVATSNTLHIDRTATMLGASSMMSRSRKEFDGGPDFSGEDESGGDEGESGEGENKGDGWVPCDEKACSRGKETPPAASADGHNDDSDEMHLPAGQHLLVDIKDVDPNFLNSEERLARAMIDLINESRLTLLSYHCHSLVPIGVSCAGVLLESHVAFHTWPLEGVITLDLFTCGGGLLIPTLPSIERLFGVPGVPGEDENARDVPAPTMLWSHVLRGFREGFAPGYVRSKNPLDGSLGRYILGKLDFDLKRPLLSASTAHQSVNIYEVMEPKMRDVKSYVKSISGGKYGEGEKEEDNSYEATHPEHFGPDKILFLDGIIQSTLYGDAPYHESIVHPAMLAHESPERVAIIGGGEGATLREVLKYRSVEEVVIFEIDQELVGMCAEYMPEWSDCGDVEGSDADSCFDDARARLVYEDAFEWFINRFGRREEDDGNGDGTEEEKFDVIIMDALDPNTSVEIAGGLYEYDDERSSFLGSLYEGLTAEGVFVVPLGKGKMSSDPADEVGRFRDTTLMIDGLEKLGFESIHAYDEGHSHFYMPWSYLVAFKDYGTRTGWFRTAPEIDIALRRRLHKTKSGRPTLRYFDAATMVGYQSPPKAQEITYCRREEVPRECDELPVFRPTDDSVNVPSSELVVGKSVQGEHAGRGLFAGGDIPRGATLALDEGVWSFHCPPSTWSVVSGMEEWAEEIVDDIPFVEDKISGVSTFVTGYGHAAILLGKMHYAIDSGVMNFLNHGCNGTNNYGFIYEQDQDAMTELSVDLNNLDVNQIEDNLVNEAEGPYSPVYDRLWRHTLNIGDYALRDIKKGEEILTSYLSFSADLDELKEDVIDLRRQCSGKGMGIISEHDSESS